MLYITLKQAYEFETNSHILGSEHFGSLLLPEISSFINQCYNLGPNRHGFYSSSSLLDEDVLFPLPATQYCLTATMIFSGTRGPSSWSINLTSHLIPEAIFLTLFMTSTSSRKMIDPSGRKIRSISRRMSSSSHLQSRKLYFPTVDEKPS